MNLLKLVPFHRAELISRGLFGGLFKVVGFICDTAAVSGTEYSGEWAASDLLVTFAFAAALGVLRDLYTFL